jgi:hypothetical protein
LKKKVHKLTGSAANPYKLIGISSHENDYRLSWAVNNQLGLNLLRIDDLTVIRKSLAEDTSFSQFQHTDDTKMVKINLISNRCPDGFLIREMKNIDFFFQIFGEPDQKYLDGLIAGLKSITIISLAFEIPESALKKSWNLPVE